MKTITQPLPLKTITPELLSAASKDRGEPEWVLNLRLTALNNYLQLPWPNEKDEHWKRTDLAKLDWDRLLFSFSTTPTNFSIELPEPLKDFPVEWLSLDAAVKTHGERIQNVWAENIRNAAQNKFLSLVLAVANTGSCLIVPKGQVVKAPFQSRLSAGDKNIATFVMNFVFVDEAAEAQFWEETHSADKTSHNFIATFTSIALKENAKANAYFLQSWDQNTSHLQFQNVSQSAFSKYNAIAISLGGKVFHNETTIHLQGQGAENKALGVLFGDEDQNFANWITQNHRAPRTQSDIQYRGALKGKAHAFFTGMVSISKEGQQSDAYQAAKFLLLSKEARADAIPNLEILADDVKCSHGAAVGPVDEDQKFYLQTRGVPPTQAEEIIIQGFLEPVIAEIPSPIVQDQLRTFVEKKIKNQ